MPASRPARLLIGLVCVGGLAILVASVFSLQGVLSWPYALTGAAAVLAGAVRFPVTRGSSLSVVTAVIFFSLSRFGPVATVPIAAIAGWSINRVLKRTPQHLVRLAYNVSGVVLAAAASGVAMRLSTAWLLPQLFAWLTAAVVYYLVNSCLVAGVVSLTTGLGFARYWRETSLLTAPPFVVWALGGAMAGTSLQEPRGAIIGATVLATVALTYGSVASHVRQLQDRSRRAEEASALNLRIAESLALAISAPHGPTYDELQEWQEIGRATAATLGLDEEGQWQVTLAVLLRDIGMLAVPRDVRDQPVPRTVTERARLRSHPTLATEMLAGAGLPAGVLAGIAAHHERWDGTGYPSGLSGTGIPLVARIVAALDFLEGCRHPRDGQPPCPASELGARLSEEAGSRFDPQVVEAVAGVLARREIPDRTGTPDRAGEPAGTERAAAVFQAITAVQRETLILHDLGQALHGPGDVEDGVRAVAAALGALIPLQGVEFVPPPDDRAPSVRVTLGTADTRGIEVASGGPPADAAPRVTCSMALALQHAGAPVGTLRLDILPGTPLDGEHERVLHHVGTLLAARLASGRLLDAAQREASTDVLTGLANRRLLAARAAEDLDRCARSELPLTLLLIDLDGFKRLNDTCGHAYGDLALRMAADVLRASIRVCDTAARLGGDEFVLLLPGCDGQDAAVRRRAVQDRLCAIGVDTPSGRMTLGASVGAACCPEDGRALERLLEVADGRMYEDKQRRKHAA